MKAIPMVESDKHLPALDGLRGLAILMVMVHHFSGGVDQTAAGANFWFARLTGAGWCGVDLFFVLSGFLITGILYDTKGTRHCMRNFYGRRVLRICPLYYGVLLGLFVILPLLFKSLPGVEKVGQSQGWLWLYCSNIAAFFAKEEILRGGLVQTGHFWSLAVEEQFYLIWPIFVLTFSLRADIPACAGASSHRHRETQ